MHGISTINVELTSRCNKKCHMCGRRKLEKENPDFAKTLGDMDFGIVKKIAREISPGTVVQLHWNGEPTLYHEHDLFGASEAFRVAGCYVCMNTNGLKLYEVRHSLYHFYSITVSVIQDDSSENYIRQINQLELYLLWKSRNRKQLINIRALGKIPKSFNRVFNGYKIPIIKRIFHSPDMSRNYTKEVVKPEIGVCLDLLHHPAIDRHGNVYPCVRNNPRGFNLLGNVREKPLYDILRGEYRRRMILDHFKGLRDSVPLCNECDFYGVPRG